MICAYFPDGLKILELNFKYRVVFVHKVKEI